MSPVEFKKRPSRPVEFKGQSPHYTDIRPLDEISYDQCMHTLTEHCRRVHSAEVYIPECSNPSAC